jgi:hypothetical protein
MRRRGERGSAVPLIALVVLTIGGAIVLLGRVGGAAVDRASARTAADAAALAGAAEGQETARSVAAANGARVTSYRQLGLDTEVRVRLGKATAVARAQRQGGGPGSGVAPALRAVLTRAAQLVGQAVPVRDVISSSTGQAGMAVNVTPEVAARLAPVARKAGLCPSGPTTFEVCR